jgi:isopentenyldiphosphate isomerase
VRDEIIDIVDEQDRVVGQATRGEAYDRRLRHRCSFVLVRDGAGRIFVHRRTPDKAVFPSAYDMWVGGVLAAGESYDDGAVREAREELGAPGLREVEFLFKFLWETPEYAWWSAVYRTTWDGPVHPQAEEVAWHTFLTAGELEERLASGDGQWVPDGLAAYRRLLAFNEDRGHHEQQQHQQ